MNHCYLLFRDLRVKNRDCLGLKVKILYVKNIKVKKMSKETNEAKVVPPEDPEREYMDEKLKIVMTKNIKKHSFP